MEMSVWVYPGPDTAGFMAWDCSKAIAAGLEFRPLADTARDTLAWWKQERAPALPVATGPEKDSAAARLCLEYSPKQERQGREPQESQQPQSGKILCY